MRLIRSAYCLWLSRAACRDMRRARFYADRVVDRAQAASLLVPSMGAAVPLIPLRR